MQDSTWRSLNHFYATMHKQPRFFGVLQTFLCCALHLQCFPNSICHTHRDPPFPFLNVTASILPFPVPSLFWNSKLFCLFLYVLCLFCNANVHTYRYTYKYIHVYEPYVLFIFISPIRRKSLVSNMHSNVFIEFNYSIS